MNNQQPFAAKSLPGVAGGAAQQQQPPEPITSPTLRDVLNGRGQGVQRHPGNVKYRTLVYVNKGLYAKCPRSDKIKISKGIVNAIRALGGRFLELDERNGIYNDIGDKKATEKTSQALREGQKDIRQELYKNNEMDNFRQMSNEGYFGYSVQVLESLYCGDATAAGTTPPPMQQQQTQPPPPADLSGSANSNQSAQIIAALDQFPGAAQQMPTLPSVSKGEAAKAEAMEDLQRPTIGRFTDTSMRITEMGRQSSFRLTNMSMLSGISGISDLIESARNFNPQQVEASGGGDTRNTGIQSVLTSEIRDLIRMSESQLMQAETFMGGQGTPPPVKMDTEVVMKDTEDRVSELRFTDVSRPAGGSPSASASSESMKNDRQSSATNYSKTSLMDASMMTIDKDDMSTHSGSESDAKRQKPSPQDAHLLLGLGDKTKEEAV